MNNDSNDNQTSDLNADEPKFKLPDPDLDNITVLTENLPNKPILPWNRYDSDWDENLNQDIDIEEKEQDLPIEEVIIPIKKGQDLSKID
ncbi:hypothetical protein GM3708_3152 [Geminocystis sp. NIES-3708]|uniref:hypothetical protein n=1 Tax=Geminocystis sp. NIES-3708 TaxID=1615909 RepID=UPI0005FC6B87|nr:hypothetical protein [Geminocystis sp. NIES-3708]BAQ62746.1 hypothetical protein GM3708_3152 [Geminocystis sp. NIES-3708]